MTVMTTGRLELASFDAEDIESLAAFYSALTGWEVVRDSPELADADDGWLTLRVGDGQEVGFQKVGRHVPPQWPSAEHPQQLHLDLTIEDTAAAAKRAIALGGKHLADGAEWITMADPAGHPFDLCQRDGVTEMGLFTITIDAPDASALARFYAALLGMEVTYDGDEGAFITAYDRSLMFQQVAEYNPPRWPDPDYPQQGHLDIVVDDLDAGEALALGLGATAFPEARHDNWRVFADPAGHPFCLTLG